MIYSASYSAIEGGGKSYDVTAFMRQIISGDSLVLDIENHNFVADKNFVEKDPKTGTPKRLQVSYSYDGEPAVTIVRQEHSRLVLPEDSEIKKKLSETLDKCLETAAFAEKLVLAKKAAESELLGVKKRIVEIQQKTIPGNSDVIQQAASLGALPVYFQDLDVKLLVADIGATFELSKTTFFLKLSLTSDDDTGLRDLKICFSINGQNYVESPIDDLCDWILRAPFNNPQYPYKSIDEKPLETVSLWHDIQHNGLKAGLVKTGWVGIDIPTPRLPSEEVKKVKIEMTKPQPRRTYRFYFSDFPETFERVIHANFRRPS